MPFTMTNAKKTPAGPCVKVLSVRRSERMARAVIAVNTRLAGKA